MAYTPHRNCAAMKHIVREAYGIADIWRDEATGEFDDDFFSQVMDMMEEMKPEELGAIAACGSGFDAKGKQEPINDASYISRFFMDHQIKESDSGLLILRKVAAATVIAHVEDLISFNKKRIERSISQ